MAITRSGARISTDTEFQTYEDTIVEGYQTNITVANLTPSTWYFAKALAEVDGNISVSENYVKFKTTDYKFNYITFTANTAGTTIGMTHYGTNQLTTKPVIYYSYDQTNWTEWDYTTITLNDIGERLYMYGTNQNGISRGEDNYSMFTVSGSVSVSGDATTLLSQYGTNSVPSYAFYKLFSGCTALTTAPALPATTLANYCYGYMFSGCTALTTAPALPATTLAESCYQAMFDGCTALTTAPTLAATTLANACYYAMFGNCTSLTTAPVLPATTLVEMCYASMFANCRALTTAPTLAATVMANACYASMFHGCTSLTSAPELPATTLATSCYFSMFEGCTSLTTAPVLPAMETKINCYQAMFKDCTSLTTVPALPATTLTGSCYQYMFQNCTSLTTAQEILPATTLAEYCYYQMFYGCTLLQTAPMLPAPMLVSRCYAEMFRNCRRLNSITCLAINEEQYSEPTYYWVRDVSASGTFTRDERRQWNIGNSGIPSGWDVEDYVADNYLAFTTVGPLEIGMSHHGTNATTTKPVIYWSTDKENWTQWDYTTIYLNDSETVYMYGDNPNGVTHSYDDYSNFTFLGNHVYASGDLTCLLYKNGSIGVPQYGLSTLFYNCTTLETAPELPATALDSYAYAYLFQGCAALATAPELPALNLSSNCYRSMFQGCTSLTTAPALPVMTLAGSCYYQMFKGCTSLTTAPELPATTLANSCYKSMFERCTSLTTAPVLPAETMVESCYEMMFYRCTRLNSITCLAEHYVGLNNSINEWVYGVASYGTFTRSTEPVWPTGASGIPDDWDVIDA